MNEIALSTTGLMPHSSLQDQMSRLFRGISAAHEARAESPIGADIYGTEGGGIRIAMDIPGVERDAVEIQFDDGDLTVACSRTRNGTDRPIQVRRGTDFNYRFRLSDSLDHERIEARLANGVLTIEIPQAEGAGPRRIPILEA